MGGSPSSIDLSNFFQQVALSSLSAYAINGDDIFFRSPPCFKISRSVTDYSVVSGEL